MKVLHEDLQIKDFEQPEGVEILEYCTVTGQLASEGCTSRDTGVYKTEFMPDVCQIHGGVIVTQPEEDTTTTSETLPHQRTEGSTSATEETPATEPTKSTSATNSTNTTKATGTVHPEEPINTP